MALDKTALLALIDTDIDDNNVGDIDGPVLNNVLKEMIDSTYNKIDEVNLAEFAEYDPTKIYNAGNTQVGVMQGGLMYQAKLAATNLTGAFDTDDWNLRSFSGIDPASASRLSYDDLTGLLSLTALGVVKTHTDNSAVSIAAFVAASYTGGGEFQDSDMILLTAATGGAQVYIHNGGVAGTVADFTLIELPGITDTAIRALFSATGTGGMIYTPSTGVFNLNLFSGSTAGSVPASVTTTGTQILQDNGWTLKSAINVSDFINDAGYLTSAPAAALSAVLDEGNNSGLFDIQFDKTDVAASTATQKGSQGITFKNSLWDGASEVVTTFDLKAVASVLVNEATNLELKYEGTTIFAISQTGGIGIGQGVNALNTLDLRADSTDTSLMVLRNNANSPIFQINVNGISSLVASSNAHALTITTNPPSAGTFSGVSLIRNGQVRISISTTNNGANFELKESGGATVNSLNAGGAIFQYLGNGGGGVSLGTNADPVSGLRLRGSGTGTGSLALLEDSNAVQRFKMLDNGSFGFFGVTPAAQQSHITDPTGGATVDAESRTAINAINALIETFGWMATS